GRWQQKVREKQRAQTESDYSNGAFHGRGRDSPCVFSLPRKCKRTDILEAVRKESPWGFRMPEIYLLQRCRTGFRIHPGIQPYGGAGLYRNPVDQKAEERRKRVGSEPAGI